MSENAENKNNIEENRDFLESLPAIRADETFCFDCNPEVPCFNRCCSELTLPLTPYDVMRLRRHLGLSSEDFISRHTAMQRYPDTGFPMPLLRMSDMPDEPCPFVTPAGCSVYESRPSACRAYPLGRGTTLGENGAVVERFFIVGEDHCHGFDVGVDRTPHEWFADQGLTEYNAANDRYMRLMAEFDNFRRRTSRERLELIEQADKDVLLGFLPIIDDCERALDVLRQSDASEAAIEGTELILNKLFNYLKSRGVTRIEAKGQNFDTDFHEAVAQFPAPSPEMKNKVIDVTEQGYLLKGKVMRFAKVVVGI